MGKKKGITINCEYCGTPVYKTLTDYNRHQHHFCGNECSVAYRAKEAHENRQCEVCKNSFYVLKTSTQRFCSRECQCKWQTTNTGKNNVRFQGLEVQCDWCKATIQVGKSNLERYQHHFCDSNCRKLWYSNVFSQSETWKEKSRIRGAELCAKQGGRYNTRPQLITNELLDQMKIPYVNEVRFGCFSVDNYLPESNLIIEVMGDYWHSNPLQTKTSLNDMQLKRIEQDKSKCNFIKNEYRINILYLWEYDLINRPILCQQLIKKYVETNGELNNYHSFNYTYNEELVLDNNIIAPFEF